MSAPTQNDRALKMLRSAGRRGITQLDADTLPKPIRRLASRINDLRTAGYLIATPGRRHKMAVYVLVAEPARPAPAPSHAAAPAAALFEALPPAPRSPLDPWEGDR